MTSRQTFLEELQEIYTHLHNDSFRSFIMWKSNKCIIKNIELFHKIVLPTFLPHYNIEDFYKFLQNYDIKSKYSLKHFFIDFPEIYTSKFYAKSPSNSFFKRMDCIEEKQEKLYKTIKRVQEKLKKAIIINQQIKKELKVEGTNNENLIINVTSS